MCAQGEGKSSGGVGRLANIGVSVQRRCVLTCCSASVLLSLYQLLSAPATFSVFSLPAARSPLACVRACAGYAAESLAMI